MTNSLLRLGLVIGLGTMVGLGAGCKKVTPNENVLNPDIDLDPISGETIDILGMGGTHDDNGTPHIPTGGNFASVLFGYDSSRISPEERSKFDPVTKELGNNRSLVLVVEGHCDERGSREYNLTLGERRALAVREYLVGLGIDSAIIQTKSYGEEMPARLGHDEESWRSNRRAEFRFFE